MSVVNNNSRATQINLDPFATQPQMETKPQSPIQEQAQSYQEEPKPQAKEENTISYEDYKKEFKNQSLTLSKHNLAILKVLSKMQHITQAKLLDDILENHFKAVKFDEKIQNMIKEQENLI